MAKTISRVAPVLPKELERYIFDIAAHASPERIPTFLRVARRVQIWLEPLLFNTVWANDSSHVAKTKAVLTAMDSRPPEFFQRSVRQLFIETSTLIPPYKTSELLSLCSKAVNFALFSHFPAPALLPILGGMRLRRLSASLTCIFGTSRAIDLTHPLFRSITHLEVFDHGVFQHQEYPEVATRLAALPALTHLCLNDMVTWPALRAILADCTYLKVLVNLWSSYACAQVRADEFKGITPFRDLRLVVAWVRDWAGDWEQGAAGGGDFWIAAEKLVAGRRMGIMPASDLFCFPPLIESARRAHQPQEPGAYVLY
ncbi:hypothetical protein C8R47DRAFT_1169252 [Mycena vitilis]|nr:hypothetical protein C8R47DRAFT_1169252 [Mycena vitilis]